MSSPKVFFFIAFGLLVLSSAAEASCNICSMASYAACMNETSFHPCSDGKTPSKQILTCKGNTVCTDTQGVCQPNGPGVVFGCILSYKCDDCYRGEKFACVSQTQYAFCTPDAKWGHVASCEQGKLCSVSQLAAIGQICQLECVAEPTCENTELVSMPDENWRKTCVPGITSGYYPNVDDTTCKTYVHCEEVNNVMNAVQYICPTGYYFDVVSQGCTRTKPSTCF